MLRSHVNCSIHLIAENQPVVEVHPGQVTPLTRLAALAPIGTFTCVTSRSNRCRLAHQLSIVYLSSLELHHHGDSLLVDVL